MDIVDEAVEAITAGDTARVERLVAADPSLATRRRGDGLAVVSLAAYHGRPDIVEALLRPAPTMDLVEASTVGRSERVAELLASGADPAARSPDGFTPLHLAAFFGHAETARLLISAGAPVDAVSANPLAVHPLNSAAAGRHADVVAVLLQAGADPDASDASGFRPLHAAAQNGDLDSVTLLLEAGADPGIAAADGSTAADLARAAGHTAVADRIEGARGRQAPPR
jgi:ankyrin repeat protein